MQIKRSHVLLRRPSLKPCKDSYWRLSISFLLLVVLGYMILWYYPICLPKNFCWWPLAGITKTVYKRMKKFLSLLATGCLRDRTCFVSLFRYPSTFSEPYITLSTIVHRMHLINYKQAYLMILTNQQRNLLKI